MKKRLVVILFLWCALFHACTVYRIGSQPASMLRSSQQAEQIRLEEISLYNDSVSLPNGLLYRVEYEADYRLDDLIGSDVKGLKGFYSFAARKLLGTGRVLTRFRKLTPGCTAFVSRSENGDILYARNFDFTLARPSPAVITYTAPEKMYRSVSMTGLSMAGFKQGQLSDTVTDVSILAVAPYLLMDGMNEKGLAVSVLYLDDKDTVSGITYGGTSQFSPHKRTLMTTSAMRFILDRTTCVDEAIDSLRNYNMFANGTKPNGSYHFLLADTTGRAVVLEYIPERVKSGKTIWKMNTVDTDLATNFYLSPSMYGIGHGHDRFETARSLITHTMSMEQAMDILSRVSQTEGKELTSNTQWSVVYNLTRRTYMLCVGRHYDCVYFGYL